MDNRSLKNIKYRKVKNNIFKGIFILCTLVGVIFLILLISDMLSKGLKNLDWDFLTSFPSRKAEKSGILPAMTGSLWLIILTTIISLPVGVGTAIYLEEYAKENKLNKFIQINISNLAGVPSIIYGLLGLSVFVKSLGFGPSILSGALTLSLLILPVIITSTQEAVKSVPDALRQGSLALGVTKWQTITGVVLPYAMPGILTGSILAVSRALGEAAPLLVVGAAVYISFLPTNIMSSFSALPIQIYNWTARPQEEFQQIAASGILVLMVVLLSANAIAILLRNKYQKRLE
ncbi:phosphate ABC transporter permease PstA [Clostridium sp. SYSU_GA19001]|uniref:phosphate ABC transporter permease PstA n=1 Tax=Clostridium caldaquaticum TaxID=2940653 RepID=UPI002076DA13|nr:phosphate ABC transporter permease PstA [Clostridium caldaquaticum]MCM8711558.1 phosphate ABC transporter permease PstA [Clostridium caldaquaticum]